MIPLSSAKSASHCFRASVTSNSEEQHRFPQTCPWRSLWPQNCHWSVPRFFLRNGRSRLRSRCWAAAAKSAVAYRPPHIWVPVWKRGDTIAHDDEYGQTVMRRKYANPCACRGMLCFTAPTALQFGPPPGPNQEYAMGQQSSGMQPPVKLPEDRLDSWKEIAAYLNRDVTTVQRWEKREGMPVRRHLHARMGSVYAARTALDAWTLSRNLRTPPENGTGAASLPVAAPGARSAISRSPG